MSQPVLLLLSFGAWLVRRVGTPVISSRSKLGLFVLRQLWPLSPGAFVVLLNCWYAIYLNG
jgi:hypothetical protein